MASNQNSATQTTGKSTDILSIEDFQTLSAPKPDFKAHLLLGPRIDDLDIVRDGDAGHEVEFGETFDPARG